MTERIVTTPVVMRMKGHTERQLMSKTPSSVRHTAFSKLNTSLNNQNISYSNNINNKGEKLSITEKENYSGTNTNDQSTSITETPTQVPVGILGIRKRLEQQISAACNTSSVSVQEISPGLAKIQNTPGTLKKRRRELIIKHKDIQNRCDQLGVGGGVTLWPEMDIVRMTFKDMLYLLGFASLLSLVTVIFFNKIHGKTFMHLQGFSQEIRAGCANHRITVYNKSLTFNDEVISWHKFLLYKSEKIQAYFDMSVTSSHCIFYLVGYISGMSALAYFLVDSMRAKNRLTPLRIKTWTCLLVVIGTWTVLMSFGLNLAYRLEQEVVLCVKEYASALGYLVLTDLDLNMYQSVLLYWRSCILDSGSHGLTHVLGIVTVKDLIYYLQYYSIPVATVLLSPVVKLIMNLWTVYGKGEHIKLT